MNYIHCRCLLSPKFNLEDVIELITEIIKHPFSIHINVMNHPLRRRTDIRLDNPEGHLNQLMKEDKTINEDIIISTWSNIALIYINTDKFSDEILVELKLCI